MKAVTVTLFVLTALVTGLHNVYGLMNTVNGAPFNLLNFTALLGSVTLAGAAMLVPFRPHVAAALGFAGSLLLWVYYAPLTIVSFLTPFTTRAEIQGFITFHDYVPLVGMLVGPVLLIVCTIKSVLFFKHHPESAGKAIAQGKS
jgi:hypothetical protein